MSEIGIGHRCQLVSPSSSHFEGPIPKGFELWNGPKSKWYGNGVVFVDVPHQHCHTTTCPQHPQCYSELGIWPSRMTNMQNKGSEATLHQLIYPNMCRWLVKSIIFKKFPGEILMFAGPNPTDLTTDLGPEASRTSCARWRAEEAEPPRCRASWVTEVVEVMANLSWWT